MARVISVMPAEIGWQVSIDGEDAPLTLDSGAEAEAKALEIARRFAKDGEAATVEIQLADGSLAARSIAPSAPAGEGWRWRTALELA